MKKSILEIISENPSISLEDLYFIEKNEVDNIIELRYALIQLRRLKLIDYQYTSTNIFSINLTAQGKLFVNID